MSFIDKFLDVTTPLPRKICRYLKLYIVVEERSKEINKELKTHREEYLKKIKEKEINNNDLISLKNTIDKLYLEILTLSDYKQEILKELNYILESSFLNKIEPIIEEGRKECQEKLMSNIPNNYDNNSFTNSLFNKTTTNDLKKISDFNEKKPKNDDNKLLGNKKYKSKTKKIASSSEISNEGNQNLKGNEDKKDVFCKCHRQSFGLMIQCDNCGEWFHYECVNLVEGYEPKDKEWYCEFCEKKNKNQKKTKKKKKVIKLKEI